MAISVQIGNVSKRKNSTFQPTLTASVDVVLKDGTSDRNPSFLLNSGSPISANYLKWGSRYYFITDIVYERNNLYTINCKLDAMATYKANIAATSAFVAYDGTSNTEITDGRLSIETTKTITANSQNFSKIGTGYCVVISVTGKSSCASYAMPIGTASVLLDQMQNWMDGVDVLPIPDMTSITDIAEAIGVGVENLVRGLRQLMATGRAADCIRNAFIMPIAEQYVGGNQSFVYLGDYNTQHVGSVVSPATVITDNISLAIPWPSGISDWRRNAPYTRLYLYLPYTGCIEIPTGEIMGDANMTILTSICPMTGDAIFTVASGTRKIAQFNTNLGVPYAIGSSNITPLGAATAIGSVAVSGAAAMLTGGASAALSATAGIIGATNNLAPIPSTVGSNAGGASFGLAKAASLFTVFHDTNVAPNSVAGAIGTPAMAVKTLGGLSGYVECRAASVSAPAEDTVLDEINNYLNSGFFME